MQKLEDGSTNQLKMFLLFCHMPVWKVSAADGSGQAPAPQNFKVKSALLRFCVLFVLSATLIYRPFNRFQSRDSDTESVMSTELFVEGIAINSRGENQAPLKYYFFPPSNVHMHVEEQHAGTEFVGSSLKKL